MCACACHTADGSRIVVGAISVLTYYSLVVTLAVAANNAIPTRVQYCSRLYCVNTMALLVSLPSLVLPVTE